ncbi:hypothetical protein ACIBKX_34000 [Streptomyces sp. NPDC050658]|uniref:DUF3846 domain-containing protein n=1 Tax=unclassified Streptomyces TaxID=2593676 RepID=UPI003430D917
MTSALCIAEDGEVTDVELPSDPHAQRKLLSEQVGGASEAAYYHRSTVLHLHAEGAIVGLPPNITSWALACVWRRMNLGLDYALHGPVVATGAYGDDGELNPLPDEFAAQVRTAAATVRETLQGWRTRPPASNEAALAEALAYVRRDLA